MTNNEIRDNIDDLIKITCMIKGHRPPKLGGYEKDNPTVLKVKPILYEQILKHIEEYKVTRFICGGALGVDQIALEILSDLKQSRYNQLKIILALPFADFMDRCWYKANIENTTQTNIAQADEVVYVDAIENYQIDPDQVIAGKLLNEQLKKRDHYAADHSAYMLAVWDNSQGGTGGCVNYFKGQLPLGKKLTVINHVKGSVETIDR